MTASQRVAHAQNLKPFFLGIAGGTGSGKTTLAVSLVRALGDDLAAVIDADGYYRDLRHLPLHERHLVNFDHPDSLDFPLLSEHIQTLRRGQPVLKYVYDFATHSRSAETVKVLSKPLVIVEGMLLFTRTDLCRLFDYRIFLEEDDDLRLLRRIMRDTQQRGRSLETVADQYLRHVRPMHRQFVEPSKKAADLVLHAADALQIIMRILSSKLHLHPR